jgi:hypothetical protein
LDQSSGKSEMARKRKQQSAVWYEPADPTPRHQCPCCDFVTLPERGNYLICPICFWEDDGQDVDALDETSGPNHGMTLREARINFKQFGACEESMIKNVLPIEDRSRFERHSRRKRAR